jgi:hypothetical protein
VLPLVHGSDSVSRVCMDLCISHGPLCGTHMENKRSFKRLANDRSLHSLVSNVHDSQPVDDRRVFKGRHDSVLFFGCTSLGGVSC